MKKTLFLSLFLCLLPVGCGRQQRGARPVLIDIPLTREAYAFGVDPGQPLLLDRVNTFIATVRKDGTLDRICDAYFAGGEPTPVISCPRDDSKDQLIVATNAMISLFEICKGPLPLPKGEVPQRGGEGKRTIVTR